MAHYFSFVASHPQDIFTRKSFIQCTMRTVPFHQVRTRFHQRHLSRIRCTSQIHSKPLTQLLLPNEKSTYCLGHLLGSDCRPSDVLFLHGQLGAGKTAFARGYIHAATGDSSIQVTSPTYLLTNTYLSSKKVNGIRPSIYHMDLWRLDDALSRPIVDFENIFQNEVSLIEWPDRLKTLQPSERLDIFIEYSDTNSLSTLTKDDPWGFGSGELDDTTLTCGSRLAHFISHGQTWKNRTQKLYMEYAREDNKGNLILNMEPS